MLAPEQRHQRLYDDFRAYYERVSESCQVLFDSSLFEALKLLHLQQSQGFSDGVNALLVGSQLQVLLRGFTKQLKERLLQKFVQYERHWLQLYTELNGVRPPGRYLAWAWDRITVSLDLFCNQFSRQVYEAATSTPNGDAFSQLFPPQLGRGKFHARLKTLVYMQLLYAVNAWSAAILQHLGLDGEIWAGASEPCTGKCGIYELLAEDAPLWQSSRGFARGELPPSHFGSHEIILPTTNYHKKQAEAK